MMKFRIKKQSTIDFKWKNQLVLKKLIAYRLSTSGNNVITVKIYGYIYFRKGTNDNILDRNEV